MQNHFWIFSHKVKHWHQLCLLKNQLDLRELSVKASYSKCICENSILPFVVFKKELFQVLTAFLIVSCYCFLIKVLSNNVTIANIWLTRFDVPIYCIIMVFLASCPFKVKFVGFISEAWLQIGWFGFKNVKILIVWYFNST